MNFIAELTPHFVPFSSALLLSLILTPVNFKGGDGIAGDGGKGGDGGGGNGGGEVIRKDGDTRGELGERGGGGRGIEGVETGLLQRDEVVVVLEGGRGESGRGTTDGVSDLGRRLEKVTVTVVAGEEILKGARGNGGEAEGGRGGGGGAGGGIKQRTEGADRMEETAGIDEEVGEERIVAGAVGGGTGEEGCGERRIREIGKGEKGIRSEEEGRGGGGGGGRGGGRRLPFGLQGSDPDNVCLQAMHFSVQQQSTEDQRRANDSMMTTTMTTTTMLMTKSAEEESLTHSNRFVISVNATKYIPGQTLTVTVSSPIPYRGFLLQARRYGSPVVVGSFLNPPLASSNETEDLVFFNCDGVSDTLLAWLPRPVVNLTTVWLPTNEDLGLIQFVATIFISEIDFRSNVTSKVLRKGFRSIELDDCGKLKGCFRYLDDGRDSCDADTCEYLVTYQVLDTEAQFEMSALADWVSIAFSSDERMGGDDVFMCVRNRWTVDVRRYVTEVGYQPPIQKDMSPLYDVQGEVGDDDRVSCRFRRPLKVTHDSEDQFSIDLNNNWFQLYAWGPVSASGGIVRHSLERPPTSQAKLSLRPTRNEFMTGTGLQLLRPSLVILLSAAAAALLQLLSPLQQQQHQQLVCCIIICVCVLALTDGPCRLN